MRGPLFRFKAGFLCCALILGCTGEKAPAQQRPERSRNAGAAPESPGRPRVSAAGAGAAGVREKLSRTLAAAEIPPDMARCVTENAAADPGPGGFLAALETVLSGGDPALRRLVDKQHPLPENYEPADLIELRYGSYRAGIADTMLLRRDAEAALEAMAAAAKKEGITVTVSSAYRSYQYQIGSFDRWTKRLGLEEAERVSARPGRSQHQLGLVVDFGSISNDFAATAAGKWTAANAGRFGWSLSYPRDREALTGYAWESWHYRYVGPELVSFIETWFGGVQQYALRFIHEWEAAP